MSSQTTKQNIKNFELLPKEKLAYLLEICRVINSSLSLDTVLDRIMQETNQILNAEASSILLIDPKTNKLYFRTTTGVKSQELKKFTLDMGEGIAGWVAQHAQPVLVKDAKTDKRFSRQISEMIAFPTESMMCVPLSIDGRIMGVMELLNKTAQGYFDDKDLLLATMLTGFAAIAIDNARIHTEEHKKRKHLQNELQDKYIMTGTSRAMQDIFKMIGKVASTQTTVHISGASGTGKELVARNIHHQSDRAGQPFVCVACSILTGTLLESELFGYEKGAFTGADKIKIGKFEAADGGTIFLDEIGTLNHETQIKLLRVLEERQIERVGGNQLIDIDIRVISATNEDLPALVKEGKFREDLLYRLKVVDIQMPALSQLKEDIPLLADRFLKQFSFETGRNMTSIDEKTMALLLDYSWPGNVRELRNTIERAVVLGEGEIMLPQHLPGTLTASKEHVSPQRSQALDSAEQEHIEKVLIQTAWNKSRAARQMNISRNRLDRKIKQFGINSPDDVE